MSTEGRPRAEGRRANLMQALREVVEADDGLISTAEARALVGCGPKCILRDLSGFPAPVSKAVRATKNREARQAMFRRAEVEAWMTGYSDALAATKARVAQAQRVAAAARHHAAAHSLIGLPSELAVVRSLRRDLFDEDPLTAAPAPCSHWAVLLRKAGERCDGRDVSLKVLAAERETDRTRAARTRLSLGHSPLARPKPSNLELSGQSPMPGKRGHKAPQVTLAHRVDAPLSVGV